MFTIRERKWALYHNGIMWQPAFKGLKSEQEEAIEEKLIPNWTSQQVKEPSTVIINCPNGSDAIRFVSLFVFADIFRTSNLYDYLTE